MELATPSPDLSGTGDRKVLVLGATGLIGSAIVARLSSEGISVVAAARRPGSASRRLRADDIACFGLDEVLRPEDWASYLVGIDTVINCAGVLQDGRKDSTWLVHVEAPVALYAACENAGVRQLVHFSALGVDQEALSDFSKSKAKAEEVLRSSRLDWVILRPSVVLGRAAYGGSALFRGLASLPYLPRLTDAGALSVVQLDDVVETVIRIIGNKVPPQTTIDLVGPEQLSFEDVVAGYRRWLGWRAARLIILPRPLMSAAYMLGDLAGWLGWRPPIRSTARAEMQRGAAGDPAPWTDLTGIVPRSLDQALAAEPSSVQERWFSRLFILKPVVFAVFAAFWFLTAFVSLGPGYGLGKDLMIEGGAGALSGPTVVAGGLADVAVGAGILWRRTTKQALWAALCLTIFYVIAGTAILPRLWNEPLGPMMKVWPILALNFVALAILDER